MICIGITFNTDTYIKIKEQIPTSMSINKPNLQTLAEFYSGIPIHQKAEQEENCYAFTNRELLNKYLKGDYDEEYLQTLIRLQQ